MINRLANSVAFFCVKQDIISKTDKDNYSYGFELIIASAINLVLVLLAGVLIGIKLGTVVFLVTFILTRCFIGGYHANTHAVCIILFTGIFIIIAVISIVMIEKWTPAYILISSLVFTLSVYYLAPAESENKPLSQQKKKRFRRYSLILACLNIEAAIISCIIPLFLSEIIFFYFSGNLVSAISLILVKKRERGKGKYG